MRIPLRYYPLGAFQCVDGLPDIVEPGEDRCKEKLTSFDRLVYSRRDEQGFPRHAKLSRPIAHIAANPPELLNWIEHGRTGDHEEESPNQRLDRKVCEVPGGSE